MIDNSRSNPPGYTADGVARKFFEALEGVRFGPVAQPERREKARLDKLNDALLSKGASANRRVPEAWNNN